MEFEGMRQIARWAAITWGRRPGTSAEDMEQEAWVAMLQAAPAYRAEFGGEESYYFRVVFNRCTDLLRKRTELPMAQDPDAEPFEPANDGPTPEAEVWATRWAERWAHRVEWLLAGSDLARAVIVDQQLAGAVAARAGVPVRAVYNQTRQARRIRLAGDPVLAELRAELLENEA